MAPEHDVVRGTVPEHAVKHVVDCGVTSEQVAIRCLHSLWPVRRCEFARGLELIRVPPHYSHRFKSKSIRRAPTRCVLVPRLGVAWRPPGPAREGAHVRTP